VLHDVKSHALEELRAIRGTMERAGTFTAVPGWGGVAMGATAVLTPFVAGASDGGPKWVAVWIGDALVASTIAIASIALKSRQSGTLLTSGSASVRRVALAYAPPIVAAVILTGVFLQNGLAARLPGCWLLLYGAALTAGGALSVNVIPAMGMMFMALGSAAFIVPTAWGNWFMVVGFGGLHVLFGYIIARRYGS
jgi:hypothetical protein